MFQLSKERYGITVPVLLDLMFPSHRDFAHFVHLWWASIKKINSGCRNILSLSLLELQSRQSPGTFPVSGLVFEVVTCCIIVVKTLSICEWAQRVDYEWLFSIRSSHGFWCLPLRWHSDITQTLAKVWQFVPLGFSLFQLLSPCCLVMLLSSLLAGAGWIHKLNIAVITLEFIRWCLVSELGYLKKRAACFQAGIRFWQLLAEGFSEVTPVYLLQAGLFFFLLLPFSHVFSDSQPPTLRSAGTARDDCY